MIAPSRCAELARQLHEGFHPAIDHLVDWIGSGESLELGPFVALGSELSAETRMRTEKDPDVFEGEVAGRLYDALKSIPVYVLDDRGFWRYLSLRYFWEFINWRERKPFEKGNYLKYIDASENTESVLPRMYLRAQALAGTGGEGLAGSIPHAGDFWRSHVIRVRTGSAPKIARAFAAKQMASRLTTDPLRETAKRLNRTWTNVLLYLYDEAEAEELLDQLWVREAS